VTEIGADAKLFTIGHSTHPLEKFLALLRSHSITAIADVRSNPFSQFNPQFNREPLVAGLSAAGIRYTFLGRELGARREEAECYDNGVVCYDRIATTVLFRTGLGRLHQEIASYRIALLCAEKDPLTCHRAILICRHLRQEVEPIYHILEDGRLESHTQAEKRLLSLCKLPARNLFQSREELVEQAYDIQGKHIAYKIDLNATAEDAP
jgi:uncharacterized protein (DUF488 family)